jgi:uncharacterized protein
MQARFTVGMKCPTDNATLIMSERGGVEIDYCPDCRGVWLDRGELDKIIERAGAVPSAPAAQPRHDDRYPAPSQRYPEQYGRPEQQRPYKKKRENWLSELFD